MPVDFEVGIIGAGFAGLIAALELRRAGRESIVIFERGQEVGGVWRDNVYPGCACDVPSHLYSISSRPNPNWTSNFASQPEILDYLKNISVHDELRSRIRFGCEVTEIRFCAETGCWRVTDQRGQDVRVRAIIVAVGPHSRPYVPALMGREIFAGTACHSSRWDPAINLEGKKVAVIGTGASAVQIVPSIAPIVADLMVFQRSAPWVLPRAERRISVFEHLLFCWFPFTQAIVRGAIYLLMEFIGLGFVGPPIFNRLLAAVALRKLTREVHDPTIQRALTPTYRAGCKRMMVSDDFYPAFNRPNVHLVTEPIAELVPDGIVTTDRVFHAADHIVYATGFTVADSDGFLRVVGLEGRVLADEWAIEGAQAYLGTTVSGYPNMAILLGPNSGLSHSSALHVIESQMAYVLEYLAGIDGIGECGYLDVRAPVQTAYNMDLHRRLSELVWSSGCRSWYLNRSGENTVIFPGLTLSFRRRLRRFDPRSYSAHVQPTTRAVAPVTCGVRA
jgi:cation diffusion facilitator CzcD-associated flavoprotein CzcO